jgi:hypothetical protein
MKKEVYILKPVIKKTGSTTAYDVYSCIDFALYNKRQVVDNGIDIFADLPINSRAKTKEAFTKVNLNSCVDIARAYFEAFLYQHVGFSSYKVKCIGNKFIFKV